MKPIDSSLLFDIDTNEEELQKLDGILEILLSDRTTDSNIIWASNDYKHYGSGYGFQNFITSELITGENSHIIQPRIKKLDLQQRKRSREMAEVFTPAWICNRQNNLVDEAWFGIPNVFNYEKEDNTWTSNPKPLIPDGNSLKRYIADKRIEITCGEAPYLVSRYDVTTGQLIEIGNRIGLLDRKLWAINALTPNDSPELTPQKRKALKRQWRRMVYRAYQSIYGFEWQGDNLLLAREALFISLIEYYQSKWHTKGLPQSDFMKKIAEIISWNIWQMDGLKYGIPGYMPQEKVQSEMFDNEILPQYRLCRIMQWSGSEPLMGEEVKFKQLVANHNL